MQGIEEFQDLGDLGPYIRSIDMVGPSGVEPLVPNEDTSFADASEAFRDVLDEHYDERMDELTEDGEKLIVERLVLQADDVPYIEYSIVDEYNDE